MMKKNYNNISQEPCNYVQKKMDKEKKTKKENNTLISEPKNYIKKIKKEKKNSKLHVREL